MSVESTELIFYKSLNSVGGITSLGGGIDTNAPLTKAGVINELFDLITPDEAAGAARDEFRLIYAKNTNLEDDLLEAVVSVLSDSTSASTSISLGLDPVGYNTPSTIVVADETDSTDQLSGISFETVGTPLLVGNVTTNTMVADEYRAIWIQRSMLTGATASENDTSTLFFGGETT